MLFWWYLIMWLGVTGLRFFLGPFGLFGFCNALILPYLILNGWCFLNISFMICAIYSFTSFGLYFNNSPGILSSPVALLLFNFVKILWISSVVISFTRGLCSPSNGWMTSASSFWNFALKKSVVSFSISFGLVANCPSSSSTLGFSYFWRYRVPAAKRNRASLEIRFQGTKQRNKYHHEIIKDFYLRAIIKRNGKFKVWKSVYGSSRSINSLDSPLDKAGLAEAVHGRSGSRWTSRSEAYQRKTLKSRFSQMQFGALSNQNFRKNEPRCTVKI